MKVAIFDLEMMGFNADGGPTLCCCIKEYHCHGITTLRGDSYRKWETDRTDDHEIVRDILAELDKYDIVVAHNGEYFDKRWLNSKAVKYGFRPVLRSKKLIDPVQLCRRHLRLGRNSLAAVIDFLEIKEKKTPVQLKLWQKATFNGHKPSLNKIVKHCQLDVITLESVYDKLRPLVDKIDSRGSAY